MYCKSFIGRRLIIVANQGDYCAAKAGFISLPKSLVVVLDTRKVRVNCIAPGMIIVEM
ncbi:MAG: SDR family oxidoreductase [Eggerthellaceae bacterium]|nr:SDR family oxidoreductase [Eggerthellaceae bacterium]